MKRYIILAIALICFAVSGYSTNPVTVNNLVMQSFNKEFKAAQKIEWTETNEFVRAKFEMDAQVMFAYFTQNGELMAVTRNITREQLPLRLNRGLASAFKNYQVVDIFEVFREGQTLYYATVRNGSCSIVLESVSADDWRQYKKQKL